MIELFKQPNIDWMGKAKYFFVLSGILLLAGLTSIFFKGGLRYGIDFKGGTNVDVRFAQAPNIDRLRSGLAVQGLGNTEIQSARDIANPNSNEVLIFVEGRGQDEQTLQASREKVLSALNATYGLSGKVDFNSATLQPLAAALTEKDPLVLSVNAADRYQQLARKLLDYRDKNSNGVLTNFDDLAKVDGVPPAVLASVKNSYALGPFAIRNVEVVGPKVGAELRRQAIFVTLYALGGMLVYIAFRFEWVYGAAAVLAVFHDVLITLGFFSLLHSLLNLEISLTVIAALLTLVGYSMNDTIVIFDRIRENNRLLRKESFADVVNKSINQTLSRTILTSGLTFLTVLVLFLMGGQVLRAFSFALVVGIVVGTYSRFGIAAPLVVAWNRWRGQGAAAGPGPAAGNKARGSENVAGRLAPAGRR